MENYSTVISSIALFIAVVAYVESKKNDINSMEFWQHVHSAVGNAMKPHVDAFSQRLDRIERFIEKKTAD